MTTALDLKEVRAYALVVAEIKATKEALKKLEDKRRELEAPLMDQLLLSGIQSIPVIHKGKRHNVHLKTRIDAKAKDGDRPAVTAAMKRAGLGDLVSEGYNANSLSAWVRERLASGKALPPTLAGVIDINERTELGCAVTANELSDSQKAARTLEKQRKKREV